ncbi:hypothetical protein Tco_0024433 [Tanacetum coccineum]
MDVKLLDLHDRYYARHAVVDNVVNRRSRELLEVIEKLRGECDVIKERESAQEEESESLRASLSTLKSHIASLEVEKARLEVVKVSIRKEVDDVKRDRMELVSSAIFYGMCKAFEQVAAMKEPFDLSKLKGYCPSYKKEHDQAGNDLATATFPWLSEFVADPLALVEVLLSKKPPSLQRHAPSKTQAHVASSQKATQSSVPASNSMSPLADSSVVKPTSFQVE